MENKKNWFHAWLLRIFRAEPYRVLFILGAFCAALGAGQWTLFQWGWVNQYPIQPHSQLMVLGFMLSFVAGFLMTAVPRMTGTFPASVGEKGLAALLSLLLFGFSGLGLRTPSLFFGLFQLMALSVFFVRRKLRMKNKKLPAGFIFIPLGLLTGILGSTFLIISEQRWVDDPRLFSIGKLFLYEGFIIHLVIGLGSRLIPVLTQKSEGLSPSEVVFLSHRIFVLEAIALNASFLIEVGIGAFWGWGIRAVLMSFVLWKNFKFLKPIATRSFLAFGISAVLVTFPAAYVGLILFPEHRQNWIHLLYIGGFATLTLLVSVRVSLAHAGASLEVEKTTHFISGIAGAMFIATALRVYGAWGMASVFFLAALLVWGCFLGRPLIAGSYDQKRA